jgi:hypothetical protein
MENDYLHIRSTGLHWQKGKWGFEIATHPADIEKRPSAQRYSVVQAHWFRSHWAHRLLRPAHLHQKEDNMSGMSPT